MEIFRTATKKARSYLHRCIYFWCNYIHFVDRATGAYSIRTVGAMFNRSIQNELHFYRQFIKIIFTGTSWAFNLK
ncbi:unnamed protein product [Mucor hiemalis]